LDDATVRALLLLRARTLAAGYSGVRPDLPARLIELLNLNLLPVVPGKGSVGASGDLAQLAHLAQPLIGEGRLRAPGDPPRGGRAGGPAPAPARRAGAGRAREPPAGVRAQGGPVAGQRHRADAGAARLLDPRRADPRRRRRRGLRALGGGAARHRPAI